MKKTYSKHRGKCNRCGNERTLLSLSRDYCKPCGYQWGNCIRCLAYRKIYITGRCYCCYQDDLVRKYLNQIAAEFTQPASEYNSYLFKLYLIYIQRYRMSYDYIQPTKTLVKILTYESISAIRSWQQIYRLSAKHPLTRSPGADVHDNGCAWIKIGYMLQELGVLASRSEGYEHRIQKLIAYMDFKTAGYVQEFLKKLKKGNRADSTITRYLFLLQAFSLWLSELDPPEHLLVANQMSIECYLDLMKRTHSYPSTVVNFRRITAFYRWAKEQKLVLIDPTQNIKISRPAEKLVICSKTEFDQLGTFIRNERSDPEQALCVFLILFYGLTTEGLSQATVDPDWSSMKDPIIKIILNRKPRSRGRRYYNREQIITLPGQPQWLHQLQQRFIEHWQSRYTKIQSKASFPKTPLFLDPQCEHNRNLSSEYIRKLVRLATQAATDQSIPPRVLKQTCGHIHVRGDDASMLSQLGWSPSFSFHYTWLPRQHYQPKNSSKL